MATGGLNVFRQNAVYVGAGKQSAWGTDVAPTWFWLWLDGSEANPQTKIQVEREGDGSGLMALSYKTSQYQQIKIVEYGRPFMAGYALQGLLGTGSDSYSAPTANTTLSGAVSIGATSIQVAANLGNVGTLPVVLSAGYSSASAEVVTLDLTSKTGTGPFTYTIAASGTTAKAHLSSDPVVSAAAHAFTPKYAFDPYSIEIGYGEVGGSPSQVIRYRDCVCVDLQIESSKGKPVKFTSTWWGANAVYKSAASTASYPTAGIFRHYDASGSWKVNNVTTGNAATIDKFTLKLKRSTGAEDCQTELITPAYFLPGNLDISGDFNAVFNSWNDYNLTYFGTTSPANNATDSILVGQSQLSVTYTLDAVNSLAISLPTVDYMSAPLRPSLSAKPMPQPVTYTAQKTPAQPTPLTVTLNNTQVGAY